MISKAVECFSFPNLNMKSIKSCSCEIIKGHICKKKKTFNGFKHNSKYLLLKFQEFSHKSPISAKQQQQQQLDLALLRNKEFYKIPQKHCGFIFGKYFIIFTSL